MTKFLNRSLVLVVILIIFFTGFSGAIASPKNVLPPQSSNDFLSLQLIVKGAQVTSYSLPSIQSEKKWRYQYLQQLKVDMKLLSDAPAGWIPIEGNNGKKATRGRLPSTWIQKEDVIALSELMPVKFCWPIESMNYVAGDSFIRIKFKIDGSASVVIGGDGIASQTHQAHVYMQNNIVDIRDQKTNFSLMSATYKPELKRLFPYGADTPDQNFFSDEMLKNCTEVKF